MKMAAIRALGSVTARLVRRSGAGGAEGPRVVPWLPVRNVRAYGSVAEELETPIASPFPVIHTKLLINGEFVDSASGKTFPTIDPRSGEVIAEVSEGDVEDVNRAVKAARKAFDEGPWPRMAPHERGRILNKYADLLEEHTDELAALDSLAGGKVYNMARHLDMPSVLKTFRYYAGWADKVQGGTFPSETAMFSYTLHEPIGVVGSIVPWNFPMVMFANKVATPLVLGNSVVLKTAEQTPLSALLAGKLALEAGIPPGVLNVISGYGPTAGAAVSNHHDIDCVSFTGSTQVGRLIMAAAAASNLKRVNLELGGKSGLIVCDDADVDQAVALSHLAVFYHQGQVCCAGSRTFVQENIYDEFMEKSKKKAEEKVVGDPFKNGVEQGPQVDDEQFNKVMSYIQKGKDEGATLVTGGSRLGSKGYYIQPTVFGDVQDHHSIFKDEVFGPLQAVTKFKTIDEAIRRVNDSKYGLAAGIVTKNIDTANTVARALKVGSVWVNCFFALDVSLPFGGYKESGFGRVKGQQALENYYQVKCVSTPLINPTWL